MLLLLGSCLLISIDFLLKLLLKVGILHNNFILKILFTIIIDN